MFSSPSFIRRYMGVSQLGVNAIFGKMFPFPWDFLGICGYFHGICGVQENPKFLQGFESTLVPLFRFLVASKSARCYKNNHASRRTANNKY